MIPKAIGNKIIIDPYYEGGEQRVGSIIIPESMTDEEAIQGVVLDTGPNWAKLIGEYVLFHKGRSNIIMDGTYYVINEKDIVCCRKEWGIQLLDHRREVLVLPDWDSKYGQTSEYIHLPMEALEHNQPVMFGTVIDTHWLSPELVAGDRVVIEPRKGSEVGYKDALYYIIPIENILATIP